MRYNNEVFRCILSIAMVPMAQPMKKINIKTFLNPITLITGIILLIGLVIMALIVLFLGRQPAFAYETTPQVTMIAAPTMTPKPVEPTITMTPTQTSIPILPEGVIGVGRYVQVSGTDGAGLRMRAEPGLSSEINFTAMDGEAFLVIAGPKELDGYVWWHLEAPYDESRNGWSAGAFLSIIDEGMDNDGD